MRDRKRDKGVKVCPEVKMSEVEFLEPLDENGERDDETAVAINSDGEAHKVGEDDDQAERLNLEDKAGKTNNDLDDEEEPMDPKIAQKNDDENM